MCDTDLIAFLREWLAVLVPLAQESAARAVAQQSISVGGKGKQDRSTSYEVRTGQTTIQRMRRGPKDQPGEVQLGFSWAWACSCGRPTLVAEKR